MDSKDAEETTFICRKGSLKFLIMPFGLCNAGATFQPLIDVTMSGLAYYICLIYIDDIIVVSRILIERLERLEVVLVVFCRLNSNGSRISATYFSSLLSFSATSSPLMVLAPLLKRRSSCIGLPHSDKWSYEPSTGWPAVRNFAEVAALLSEMTVKSKRFEWSP
jgi:hypothetical protein